MTYPGGEAVTTGYNGQGLPETLTGSQVYVTEAGYNALGQKKRYTLGNGAVTTCTYYGEAGPPTPNLPSYRLWQVCTVAGGTEHQKLQYTYDRVGNVLTIADYKVAGGTQTQTFTYDALDRLLTANAAGGSAGQGQYGETYSYNSIGTGALAGLVAGDAGYKLVSAGLLGVDSLALLMIAGADLASGRSGFDYSAQQAWIGCDTLASAASLGVSAGSTALPVAPGIYVSLGGDVAQMTYDFLRTANVLPGYSLQVQW